MQLPEFMRRPAGPLEVKPEQKLVSAYFNVDNGSGKIRGIYTQGNAGVAPIFAQWIAPLKDLGVTTITMRNTGGTDHLSFDAVGIPGFQFIQDDLDYETSTHHSNEDVVRAPAGGGPEADRHRGSDLPLQRGAARPDDAAQAAARSGPRREKLRAPLEGIFPGAVPEQKKP